MLSKERCKETMQINTYFIYVNFCRTKWKRQTSVGFELLTEAGNFAAFQNVFRSNPLMAASLFASQMHNTNSAFRFFPPSLENNFPTVVIPPPSIPGLLTFSAARCR